MNDGDLVIVLTAMKSKSGEISSGLVVGTYIGQVKDKQIQVLLPSGLIFTGNSYEVVAYSSQKE